MQQKKAPFWLLPIMLCVSMMSDAQDFSVGERVWIDMPAANINDDAYGEGKVIAAIDAQKTRVFVQAITTSKAFSSGVSCAPSMDERAAWQTPEVLRNQETKNFLNTQLMPWTIGYNRYYERQNWLHSFLKWQDRHPVIERVQLSEEQRIVKERGMLDLAAVSALVLMEYDAYQGENFHIYPIPQRLTNLIPVLTYINTQFAQHPKLKALWHAKQRNEKELNRNSYTYFMVAAIDKIIEDATKNRRLLNQALVDTNDIKTFDQLMTHFKRT